MCACIEPVWTGIGAVFVECGRPKWPITMLNYTHPHPHTYREKCRFHPETGVCEAGSSTY